MSSHLCQNQNRKGGPASYGYDMLGRLTSETNPESGTTPKTYTYDSVPSPCYNFGDNQSGNLEGTTDQNGSTICTHYDALHRPTDVGTGSGTTHSMPCKRFRYDSASGVVSSPSGATFANLGGRLVEAETDNCSAWPPTPITDEWFSYSQRGELTDSYSSTAHSSGYSHLAETYWPHGALKTITAPGTPTLYYGASDGSGLDGEGRVTKVNASSGTNPVLGVTYKTTGTPVGALTQVIYGSGDPDNFSFDPNTGRMTQYQLNMGSLSDTGNLTWNANGSLGTIVITDQISSADSQACIYTHDDLGRISKYNCGSLWFQDFLYDAFGNITKDTSMSWMPGYDLHNHYLTVGASYDPDGNLTNDTFHTYTWNADNTMAKADTTNVNYDAMGRMAENGVSAFKQFIYAAGGTTPFAQLNTSSTLVQAPLPGGGFVVYNGSSISQYNHPDWLGSARLITTPAHTVVEDTGYAPFGEAYDGNANGWFQFTSNGMWTITGSNNSGLDDFMFRRYSSTAEPMDIARPGRAGGS